MADNTEEAEPKTTESNNMAASTNTPSNNTTNNNNEEATLLTPQEAQNDKNNANNANNEGLDQELEKVSPRLRSRSRSVKARLLTRSSL
jgi:hypothetical protein